MLVSWFVFYQIYSTRYKLFVKSFLDSNNNIIVVYDKNSITMINHIGLKFFGFSSVQEFKESHASISNLFLEEEDCYDKYTDGKNWIQKIEASSSKSIKVKILSKEDALNHYFQIKVSKLKFSNQYLLSFNNISTIVHEKQAIQKLAEYDPLTKIYNRVKLNEVFIEVFYDATRYNNDFSVILLDIDFFKSINDTYGHNVGDKVLVELARLINMSLRESDTFARWGGEEFMVIAEKTTVHTGQQLASRLRKEIESFSFDTVENITCSFGVTQFKAGDTQQRLLERVDKALYEAKENGRNQVVIK
jgi:diguanylate cyclase (GGDEF)-like protein